MCIRDRNSRSKFAQTLGQQYNSENRILLTGTPLQNNLGELWSLLNFLLPKVFASCDDFEKWFSMPLNKLSANEKETSLTEEERLLIINRLHQVLRPFLLRRVKKEVESELPSKVEYVIKVELSAWQKIVYDQIRKNGSTARDPSTGKIGTKTLKNLMMQLRKICNHPYLFLDDSHYNTPTDMIYRVSGKFEVLDRILPKLLATKHKVLIFSQMTGLMDILQIFFDYRGFRHLRLDGTTKADDRGERVQLFNQANSQYDIFLLSTRAGGIGLNLQTADTVILFDSDWNPQMDLQAQDRAHRIGQKSEVRVLRLVTNTWIEEEILSKAAFKMNLDEIFIQAGLFNQRSTDEQRREKLEDLFRRKNMYEELEDEIPDDEQINEMIARSEDELNIFEQMDKDRYEVEQNLFKTFKYPQRDEGRFYNYRLITEEEVPSWVKATDFDSDKKKEYGRGNRVRKQVSYFDDIHDSNILKLLEGKDDDDDEVEVSVKSRGKRSNRDREKEKENEAKERSGRMMTRRSLRSNSNMRGTSEKTSNMDSEDEDSVMDEKQYRRLKNCLLYTSPSPRDGLLSRMPSSA
eukprot:TRINITY_DN866_c0_g1_i11.p1 TRINITY_DN866_c0_g1~~TRINITY_DN866_c0_g1_i11.p1  ORF type:complete len:576 (-),score=174.21 TRINITY_DN866_c0_g1_i11:54-1781(-)